ncbi:MAG TPA: hypothetical protein VIR57_16555 [Chloroflexota bacterium]|jgi:hypothetical protein
MHNLSRRRFLGWTSVGAVGAGLLALAPRLATRSTDPRVASVTSASGAVETAGAAAAPPTAEPIVAYAHNPASGQLSLMIGTTEVTVHDPDLVARLRQLASGAR